MSQPYSGSVPRPGAVVESADERGPRPGIGVRLGAEVVGTYFIVLAILGVSMYNKISNNALSFVVALAGGLALVGAATAFGHLSGGHFNPAISLGSAIAGRTSWLDMPLYWVAQIVGALLAGLTLLTTIPQSFLSTLKEGNLIGAATHQAVFQGTAGGYGSHSPVASTLDAYAKQLAAQGGQTAANVTLPVSTAFLLETVAAALLTGLVLAAARRTGRRVAPIAIGLGYAALLMVTIPVTNGTMNPATAFTSAVFGGGWAWGQLWVFVVAPLVGAAIAGLFSRAFGATPVHDDILGAAEGSDEYYYDEYESGEYEEEPEQEPEAGEEQDDDETSPSSTAGIAFGYEEGETPDSEGKHTK